MRLGILSFAHLHAEAYVQNVRAMRGVELVGIADQDSTRGQRFARDFAVDWFNSYDDLLAEQPDGVIICSENANHAGLVLKAAAAGVPVLCEKPIATTLEDAQAMIDACQQAAVQLMIAFPMRFNTPIQQAAQVMASGQLGQIYGIKGVNQGECPRYHREWFVDKTLAGGGALMDHIVHLADVLRWTLQSEVVEVFAEANHILYADEADVETGGMVMLTFANGVFASIDCSWNRPPYYPTWGGLAMEVVAEKGLLTVDAFKQTATVYQHTLQRPTWAYWGSDANQAMIAEFVACIREGRAPAVSGQDGYKALEVVLAAYRSVETGQPVRLGA
jgi:predicted dehydrogenase